ncbi:chorismate mutase [Streptomyces sp. NPDC048172]|uniref:chorismate mutase n=1 Tax=Streptomyces sp. NPDC048172 TaxID=3365505 RepID=UPI003720DC12
MPRTTLARGGVLLAAAALLTLPVPAQAHVSPEPAVRQPLAPLVGLSARRVELADQVAAAKWFTGKPVDDPARERKLLADVARRSPALGLDPARTTAVFRDQIEANKLVQRALHARWRAHPAERPRRAPDLGAEVRPALDRITTGLLDELRRTWAVRTDGGCAGRLRAAVAHERGPDALHRTGTERALRSVCES